MMTRLALGLVLVLIAPFFWLHERWLLVDVANARLGRNAEGTPAYAEG